MANPVVHFEIGGRDRQRSDQFYTSLFGWSTSDYGPLSKAVDTGSAKGIPGYLTALGHEPRNYVMVYVEVDDIEQKIKQAVELGGQVAVGKNEIPGMGAFAWIKDIDDNLVGLWTPSSQN